MGLTKPLISLKLFVNLKPICLKIRRNRVLALKELQDLSGKLDSCDESILLNGVHIDPSGVASIARTRTDNGLSWNTSWSLVSSETATLYETADLKYTLWWLRRMCS